jgi:hypothetical protein
VPGGPVVTQMVILLAEMSARALRHGDYYAA